MPPAGAFGVAPDPSHTRTDGQLLRIDHVLLRTEVTADGGTTVGDVRHDALNDPAASALRAWPDGRATSEQTEAVLRAHGCRITRPRRAVLRALLGHDGPIDAIELTRLAQLDEPGIHEATVYRTIGVLADLGIVSHVHAGHGPSLVRLAGDDGLVAVCRDCGAIQTLPSASVTRLVDEVKSSVGFTLEPGHFALEGVCTSCA
jgi:Fur family transcriptional regulator, ferric uptake regulator